MTHEPHPATTNDNVVTAVTRIDGCSDGNKNDDTVADGDDKICETIGTDQKLPPLGESATETAVVTAGTTTKADNSTAELVVSDCAWRVAGGKSASVIFFLTGKCSCRLLCGLSGYRH